jgi:hypothetical protein
MEEYKQPKFIVEMEAKVNEATTYDKSKSDEHGEVFTPAELIVEMISQIPDEVWSDPLKTYFDPCAGKGQFPIQIVKKLMSSLQDFEEDEFKRYKHIVENQLFMSEYQKESADTIREIFEIEGVKINLYNGDTLTMPSDYFENPNQKQPVTTDTLWDFKK